ncbi:MAG: hypothetical protein ACK5LX_07960, partial [Oscillospiraceae bacterium]
MLHRNAVELHLFLICLTCFLPPSFSIHDWLRVYHFEKGDKGEFGQPVRVAALVDLTGMDTANLRFYTYDRASNTYKQLSGTDYTVDGQGYLHFTTSYGGDILICEGEIQKNQ